MSSGLLEGSMMNRELKRVDPEKLIKPKHTCISCGFTHEDIGYFGKVWIPTPANESAPGISDAFMIFCYSCFKEALDDIMNNRLRVDFKPVKSREVVKKKPRKPKKPKGKGGLFS